LGWLSTPLHGRPCALGTRTASGPWLVATILLELPIYGKVHAHAAAGRALLLCGVMLGKVSILLLRWSTEMLLWWGAILLLWSGAVLLLWGAVLLLWGAVLVSGGIQWLLRMAVLLCAEGGHRISGSLTLMGCVWGVLGGPLGPSILRLPPVMGQTSGGA
jgi:hypothetical protein